MFNVVGPSASTSLYVGDVAIYYSSQSMVAIEHQLQISVNHLVHWALQNRFSFSTAPALDLFLSSSALLFAPAVKLLGLLDSKLLWETNCIFGDFTLVNMILVRRFFRKDLVLFRYMTHKTSTGSQIICTF
jgi:hypothetical protein